MQTHLHIKFFSPASLTAALLFCAAIALTGTGLSAQSLDDITLDVYKLETCGCCVGWIEHMDQRGFASKIIHPRDMNGVKEDSGVLPKWQSCHTAVTKESFVFEGHIPAKYISRFLESPPPNALGLAVPGMPMGAPGMEMGDRFIAYDIILMNKDGSSEVYARVKSKADQ
jgi:hypothetical protein